MREITYYVADDGTQFDDVMACELYEMGCSSSLFDLEQIVVLDEDNNVLFPFDEKYNIIDNYYDAGNKVIIRTEDALEDFRKFADYCGWCSYISDITSIGTWVWYEKSDLYWDYCFKKVSE